MYSDTDRAAILLALRQYILDREGKDILRRPLSYLIKKIYLVTMYDQQMSIEEWWMLYAEIL